MRALKTILIILLATVSLLLILGLAIGDQTTRVARSTVVPAPAEWIWPQVSNLRSMHAWGPWRNMEKDQVNTWEGEDGTIGSVQHWHGDTLGAGSQQIVALEPNRRVSTELRFLEPWEEVVRSELRLDSMADGVNVTWLLEKDNDLMGRVFSVFIDMDRMLGPDLETGLSNLKGLVGTQYADHLEDLRSRTIRGYVIERVERPARMYIGKRALVNWSDMDRHMIASRSMISSAVEEFGLSSAGPESNLYFAWDERNKRADFMPALPISADPQRRIPGLEIYELPASSMLQVEFDGGHGQLVDVHLAIDEMVERIGWIHYGNVIEEFIIWAEQEADTNKWSTRVLYMVRSSEQAPSW